MENIVKDIHLKADRFGLLKTARHIFSTINYSAIHTFGPDAEFTKRLIENQLEISLSDNGGKIIRPEGDARPLILYDRLNDLESLLEYPETYEGILHEYTEISPSDSLFDELKFLNIPEAGLVLKKYLAEIKEMKYNSNPEYLKNNLKRYFELAKLKPLIDFHVNELFRLKKWRLKQI